MRTLQLKLVAGGLAALALAGSALAGPKPDPRRDYPKEGATVDPSALPKDTPPAQITDGHKPWAPAWDVKVPETPSDPPGKDEWEKAPVATEVRVLDPGCKAQRIREWYRISCKYAQRLGLISGTQQGLSFGRLYPDKEPEFAESAWAIFPARRGDRRAIEVFKFFKWGLEPDTIITEQFLEGDAMPWISVHGYHWGF